MRKPALLVAALLCLLIALALVPHAFGQAATQTDHWCPELGTIETAHGVLWLDMWNTETLNADGVALLQSLDTSTGLQAFYGDRNSDDDDRWLGVPNDLQPYLQFRVDTSEGRRWIAFSESLSEPEIMMGVALLSKRITGTGDQRGMHDICAVFVTTRAQVEAIWGERVVVVSSE